MHDSWWISMGFKKPNPIVLIEGINQQSSNNLKDIRELQVHILLIH